MSLPSVQLWQGSLSGRGIVSAVRGPPAAEPKGNTSNPAPGPVQGSVCHTCCPAVTAKTCSARVTPVHWITHESSAWRAKHFWAGVWNNMKWLRPKRTAKGRLWRQMVFPMDKHSVVCCRVFSSRGRDVGQGCRGWGLRGVLTKLRGPWLPLPSAWRSCSLFHPGKLHSNAHPRAPGPQPWAAGLAVK